MDKVRSFGEWIRHNSLPIFAVISLTTLGFVFPAIWEVRSAVRQAISAANTAATAAADAEKAAKNADATADHVHSLLDKLDNEVAAQERASNQRSEAIEIIRTALTKMLDIVRGVHEVSLENRQLIIELHQKVDTLEQRQGPPGGQGPPGPRPAPEPLPPPGDVPGWQQLVNDLIGALDNL